MARNKEIEVQTRLGLRRIDTSKVLYFPRGLAGFEGLHEFTLLQIQPEAPLLILQSLDNPEVGLLVADPFSFLADYHVSISDAEQKLLRVKKTEQVAVLVTVTIPAGKPEDTMLNLTGPILINHEAHIGLQIPQADNEGPTQVSINDLPSNAPQAPTPAAPEAGTAPEMATAPKEAAQDTTTTRVEHPHDSQDLVNP